MKTRTHKNKKVYDAASEIYTELLGIYFIEYFG